MAVRVTRSVTRTRFSAAPATPVPALGEPAVKSPATIPRRKRSTTASGSPAPKNRVSKSSGSPTLPDLPTFIEAPYDPVMIPAVLTFSFEEAKDHLIKTDSRFATIFAELPCRPYEHLEPVNPFQYVVRHFPVMIPIDLNTDLW
jgi:DNA-3-methyladenine glycosylase II